jgi:TetR/AcrR family transcriptional regulator of autoinduction and epiphytic fitness
MQRIKRTRRYRSARRTEQAAATRRQILDAARRLFLERDYASATIAAIAAEAGVAPETIYAAFGSKRGVLSALIDVSLAGDDAPIPVLARSWIDEIRREPDQRQRLVRLAHVSSAILERAGPIHAIIRSAAPHDPTVAALRREHQEARLRAQTELVRILASGSPLRGGMTAEQGGELYWILASPELHHVLTAEQGWSNDRYEAWLRGALAAQLLPCDAHDTDCTHCR